jgi:hypothetical protein
MHWWTYDRMRRRCEAAESRSMHFLIGFDIVVIILAVPALRNVALVLLGLGAVVVVYVAHE